MSLTAVLLVLDLFILPWHRIEFGFGVVGATFSRSGVESPNGFLGLLAALIAVAIVARVVVSHFTTVEMPSLPVSWGRVDLIAAAAAAALLMLKLVLETSSLAIGAWLAIPLATALLYGGYLRSRETPALPTDRPVTSP
jgi:hypothetical protein